MNIIQRTKGRTHASGWVAHPKIEGFPGVTARVAFRYDNASIKVDGPMEFYDKVMLEYTTPDSTELQCQKLHRRQPNVYLTDMRDAQGERTRTLMVKLSRW